LSAAEKNPPGIGGGLGGQLLERNPPRDGKAAGGMHDMRRFVPTAAERLWREKRAVGFDEQSVGWYGRRHVPQVGRRSEGHHASEAKATATKKQTTNNTNYYNTNINSKNNNNTRKADK
jgi:hypothetical protein